MAANFKTSKNSATSEQFFSTKRIASGKSAIVKLKHSAKQRRRVVVTSIEVVNLITNSHLNTNGVATHVDRQHNATYRRVFFILCEK